MNPNKYGKKLLASALAAVTAFGLTLSGCSSSSGDDETTMSIAVNVSLLRPGLPVLARIRDPDLDVTHGVFGGGVVVNPFERFAEHLVSAIVAPERSTSGQKPETEKRGATTSREPVRIVGELTDWVGHSPEQVEAMRAGLADLKRRGLAVIYD